MSGLGWPAQPVAAPRDTPSGLGWPGSQPSSSTMFHVEQNGPADVSRPAPDAPEPAPDAPAPDAAAGSRAEVEPESAPARLPEPEAALVDQEPGPGSAEADDAAARRIRGLLRDDPPGPAPAAAAPAPPAPTPVRARRTPREPFPTPPGCRILGVANQKGGVGKTTSTVNLAVALTMHGAQVLVIDLDPQGNASTGLGVEHHSGVPNVYDVLIDGVAVADVVQPAGGVDGCWCVPATIDLAGAEIELVPAVAREWRLSRALETYLAGPGADLDYVLIDCPPSLGLLTLNAMVAARELLIPIQCEYYALEGLGQLLRTVDMVKAHLNPGLELSTILLTMYDARTRLADQVAAEVRDHFGDVVLDLTIPRSVRVSEAPGYGKSVVAYDPGSRGARAYVEAARQLAARGAGQPPGALREERT